MRFACMVMLCCLSACAGEPLAMTPPPGVDFSGRWKLNEADSDDPQRLVLSQLGGNAAGAAGGSGGQGGQSGRGGRGGRGDRGGRDGGGPGITAGAPGAPALPAVGALSEGLRWPGKQVEIKQVAGVVAVTSAGDSRVFQPVAGLRQRRYKTNDGDQGRDRRPRDRDDGPPAVCGWEGRTLVVQSGDADDDHPPFEQRFSVSEVGTRLIEVIGFKGGRSGGFSMSRVWDRETATPVQKP